MDHSITNVHRFGLALLNFRQGKYTTKEKSVPTPSLKSVPYCSSGYKTHINAMDIYNGFILRNEILPAARYRKMFHSENKEKMVPLAYHENWNARTYIN